MEEGEEILCLGTAVCRLLSATPPQNKATNRWTIVTTIMQTEEIPKNKVGAHDKYRDEDEDKNKPTKAIALLGLSELKPEVALGK